MKYIKESQKKSISLVLDKGNIIKGLTALQEGQKNIFFLYASKKIKG